MSTFMKKNANKPITSINNIVPCESPCVLCVCVCEYMLRLREAVRKMEEKHFAEHTEEHVEFLPVEWRSKLTLDGGIGLILHRQPVLAAVIHSSQQLHTPV